MIHVCIPTLNRYDLLNESILALYQGSIVPDKIWIIDNGGGLTLEGANINIIKPHRNLGVAASWNWFIDNVPDIRIIMNDDVIVGNTCLEVLLNNHLNSGSLFSSPASIAGGNAFSFYVISTELVKRIGKFDENISPFYAYFEDNDFYRRMQLVNIDINLVDGCELEHRHSSTVKAYTSLQKQEHDRKFNTAKANYIHKWGGMPGRETLNTPRILK